MSLRIFFSTLFLFLFVVSEAIKPSQSNDSFDNLFHRALSLSNQGEFELGLEAFSKALHISRQERSLYKEGRCLLRLGIVSWDLGNIPGSSSFFHAARDVFEKNGDRKCHKFCSMCLEIVRLYSEGKSDRDANMNYSSLSKFEQAIHLGRELGLPGFELKCSRQKGLTYWQLGEFNLFVACNQRSLEIAGRINHNIETGRCLNNIGVYYQKQNDYSLSLHYFERALTFIKKTADQATEAECLSNTGILYRDVGDPNKALSYLLEALELDKSIGDVNSISIDMDNIGSILLRKGIDNHNREDLYQALEVFNKCCSLQGFNKARPMVRFSVLNNLGIIQSEFAEYGEARRYYNSAMKLVKQGNYPLEKSNILINIATSYLFEKNIDGAIKYYFRALNIGSESSLERIVMESCLGLGQCYEAANKPSEALAFYKRSIYAMEHVRGRISSEYFKIGFARNKMDAYQRVLKILSDLYFCKPSIALLEDIYQLIEKAKARIFYESIDESRASKKIRITPGFKEKEQQIECNIAEIYGQLASLTLTEREREQLCIRLENEEEKYIRLISETGNNIYTLELKKRPEVFSLALVRNKLIDDDTALLEYFLGDDRSYLVYISRERAKIYELPARNKIATSLRAYIKLIESKTINFSQGSVAAERIKKEILPVAAEGELDKLEALIIIPDGILHYLPFETLPAERSESFTYLVEELAISYCPSISSLLVLKRPKEIDKTRKELLAIGGPIYGSASNKSNNHNVDSNKVLMRLYYEAGFRFQRLPFTKKEVYEIGKLFPRKQKNIIIGENACEGTIKKLPLYKYRLIHFACHGILDEKYPLRSALVLSFNNQQADDGFLQMREIYNLDINADLVVLSACQTGNGVLERAEGPMGITRPFFYAGARSVVSSLWPINDKATVIFMKAFYGFLVEGHTTNRALQLTKILMIKSVWSYPFYWAGFVLNGDPLIVAFNK